MTEHGAWHYVLKEGVSGTIAGEGLNTREDAMAQLRFTYGKRTDGIRLRKAGEEYEGSEIFGMG